MFFSGQSAFFFVCLVIFLMFRCQDPLGVDSPKSDGLRERKNTGEDEGDDGRAEGRMRKRHLASSGCPALSRTQKPRLIGPLRWMAVCVCVCVCSYEHRPLASKLPAFSFSPVSRPAPPRPVLSCPVHPACLPPLECIPVSAPQAGQAQVKHKRTCLCWTPPAAAKADVAPSFAPTHSPGVF